ncbi:hypothetical protein [Gemmata obscuriglobus]|uniref:Uncharacterized protein n=1 Tax=Gemmata obscuriglobus TaxID=114 RepID=A0A2Z3H6C6_9BACT|nr:hypothetical protein [Gemmata obscuriglobus]AWM41563.1 hypothetical protein C1280_34215 [Gemmata obscuriglobus]
MVRRRPSERDADIRLTLREGTWERVLDSTAEEWAGPGSVTPGAVVAHSEVRLTVAPTSIVAYELRVEPLTHR